MTVTVDMCRKQAPGQYKFSICSAYASHMLTRVGLGDYLHDLDKTRNWSEHLEHVLIFCKVHVVRAFRKRFPKHDMYDIVAHRLFNSNSRAELDSQMDEICRAYPELMAWIRGKQGKRWIRAALSGQETKIPIEWWMNARKHTGLNESSHFSDNNFAGRKNTIIGGILKSA